MKSNKEILDEFGKRIIEDCFDPTLGNLISLRSKKNPPLIFRQYVDFLNILKDSEFEVLKKYYKEGLGSIIFDFLRIFEENEQFKLYYEKDGQRINLIEASEMLKAEPIIENGWIKRFSKEINEGE